MGWIVVLALLLVIALLCVKRLNYSVPLDVAWLKNTPIAHRGLHDAESDENSVGAFSKAISGGYGIELDVRLTKDDVPVVIHDDNLSRLFGLDKSVAEIPLADLKGLTLPKSGEVVPTLAEALAHIGGQVPVLIEIKNFGMPGELEAKVLDALEGYRGEYALQSFNPLVCRWFRNRDKDLTVGLLLEDVSVFRGRYMRNLKDNLFSAICRPGFIAYNYATITDEIAQGYRASGVTLLGWGVTRDPVVSTEILPRVDNVIFDLEDITE